MSRDMFEELMKSFKSIIEFTDEERELLLKNENLIKEKMNQALNEADDSLKQILISLYDIVIKSGNYEMTKELSKKVLEEETNIKHIANSIVKISKKIQDSIDDENLKEALRKITLISFMLLLYEITEVFIDALSEATGMSKKLLKNFAKSRYQQV